MDNANNTIAISPDNRTIEPLRSGYAVFILMSAVLLSLLAGFDIDLTSFISVLGTFFLLCFIIIKRFEAPCLILVVFTLYIPFSKIMAGSLDGLVSGLNFTNILFMVLMAYVLYLSSSQSFYSGRNPLFFPLLFLVIFTIVSTVKGLFLYGGEYLGTAVFEIKNVFEGPLLYVLFYRLLETKKSMRPVVVTILIVVFFAALLGMKEHYLDRINLHGDGIRIKGLSEQPNDTGAFFAYYMFLFIGMVLIYNKFSRYGLLAIPAFFCLRVLIFTGSRGAMLAFLCGAFLILFIRSKFLFFLFSGFLVFLFLNPALLPETAQHALSSTFISDSKDAGSRSLDSELESSASGRIVIWDGAMKIIKENPVLGIGLGEFQKIIPEYAPLVDKGIEVRDAHNAFLLITAERGIPVLLVWMTIFVIIFWNALRLYQETDHPLLKSIGLGLAAGIGALVIANCFGSRLENLQLTGYFWILTAVIMKARQELRMNEAGFFGDEQGPFEFRTRLAVE